MASKPGEASSAVVSARLANLRAGRPIRAGEGALNARRASSVPRSRQPGGIDSDVRRRQGREAAARDAAARRGSGIRVRTPSGRSVVVPRQQDEFGPD